jgi:CBS domain containing-hemolysin-like protein
MKLVAILLVVNFVFAAFLYSWATDDDISNLPKDPKERFWAILYFTVTTSTSTGYGDIVPKSIRARMASSVLQLVMLVLIVKRILEKN